jgi:hypothetical protein
MWKNYRVPRLPDYSGTMTENKYIFVGLVLIAVGILSFLGYSYYSSHKPLKEAARNPITDGSIARGQESFSNPVAVASKPSVQSTLSPITKTAITKTDYQPAETEKLFYHLVMESIKPKLNQMTVGKTTVYDIPWNRELYKSFPYRRPNSGGSGGEAYNPNVPDDPNLSQEDVRKKIEEFKKDTKRYYDSAYDSGRFYQDMITNLSELVRQFPNSPFHQQYEEDLNLIIQMQKEDEEFYDKYDIDDVTNLAYRSDIRYRGTHNSPPLDERIIAYIHCLRYSFFYKSNGRYALEFDNHRMMHGMIPSIEHILAGARLVKAGAPAAPAVLNILEDRRPIIAADEDKIPSRFYRYQDAAVEILQRMFPKAQRPFPVELLEGQYFSEYLEKQTPQDKQVIINNIKTWVEECMSTPAKPEEPPQETK